MSSEEEYDTKEHELDWRNWQVSINCLHPNYNEIKKALHLSGIPIASTIGNRLTKVIPEAWVISLNPIMPISHKSKILKTVLPFDFDGVELYSPIPEAGETEDVYIGGYGVGNYSKITPDLFKLLDDEVSDAELSTYCIDNQILR